jgi:hypothetical protein
MLAQRPASSRRILTLQRRQHRRDRRVRGLGRGRRRPGRLRGRRPNRRTRRGSRTARLRRRGRRSRPGRRWCDGRRRWRGSEGRPERRERSGRPGSSGRLDRSGGRAWRRRRKRSVGGRVDQELRRHPTIVTVRIPHAGPASAIQHAILAKRLHLGPVWPDGQSVTAWIAS